MASLFQEDGAIRVIEGPEQADGPSADGSFKVEPNVIAGKFKKFVREYAYSTPGAGGINVGTLKYREQLQQNCSRGDYYLTVNLNDLNTHEDGEVLAHALQDRPTEMVPLCERVLKELYRELVAGDEDEGDHRQHERVIGQGHRAEAELPSQRAEGHDKLLDAFLLEVRRLLHELLQVRLQDVLVDV